MMKIIIAKIIALFSEYKGTQYVGIKEYKNSYGEIANYTVIANFSYGNAVAESIKILNSLTDADFRTIAEKYEVCNTAGIQYATNAPAVKYLTTGALPKEGTKAREIALSGVHTTKTLDAIRNEMVSQFLANQNSETRSAQSLAQSDKYEKINGCVKIHKESEIVYIYAMIASKKVLVKGEYKVTQSMPETLQKQAIERYCKEIGSTLPTTKYRKFEIELGKLQKVSAMSEEFNFTV